jgi:hypothetical protein
MPRGDLVLTGGAAEVFSSQKVSVFGAEYRFDEYYHGLQPYLLGGWSTDGANYFGAGLLYKWSISPRWRMIVSSGPGYYDRNRHSKDLGSTIEFFSNLEVSYHVGHDQWLGLSFGHISNGGLNRDHNPGSELLRVVYTIPLRTRTHAATSRRSSGPGR